MEETVLTSVSSSVIEEVRKTVLSLDAQAHLILFGSRARAQATGAYVPSDSDWDFLVLTQQPILEDWVRDFTHFLELKLENDKAVTTVT